MDLRNLIKLAPAMFRGPLTGLLDRLETVEANNRALRAELDLLRGELAQLRKP